MNLKCVSALGAILFTQNCAAQPAPFASPSPAPGTFVSPSPAAAASPFTSPEASPEPVAAARAEPVQEREIVTQLQIFLDQKHFGPGIIDGRWGEFTGKALLLYAQANGIQMSPDIYSSLPLAEVYPIYTQYTISDMDRQWVGDFSERPSAMAKLKRVPYHSLLEFLSERFHASPELLRKLNRDMNMDALKPGDTVRVPNVEPFRIETLKETAKLPKRPEFMQRTVFVDTREKMLTLYDGSALLASFPITPGSKSLPAPRGRWTIVGIATLPWFRWDEAMLNHGVRSENFFNIPSGPNNPVGVLWAGLSKRGIGLHGTNNPETIGRAGSHGCIRLANWDAIRFANMISESMVVTIY